MALSFKHAYEAALQAANELKKNSDLPLLATTTPKTLSRPPSPISEKNHLDKAIVNHGEVTRANGNDSTSTTQPGVEQRKKEKKQKNSSAQEYLRQRKRAQERLQATPARRSPPRYNSPVDLRHKPEQPAVPPAPEIRLKYSGDARLAWRPLQYTENLHAEFDENLGARTSVPDANNISAREVVIGIDFGTSCTKVVIGDRSLKEAYAVPFLNAAGVASYLLPSHLSDDGEYYKLGETGPLHSDLKLSMLAAPSDPVKCARVCAYLALVIRASRSWLFRERGEQYLQADILWSLAIGQPADQATSPQSTQLFKKLGEVAWSLAGQEGRLSNRQCIEAWSKQKPAAFETDEVEILVMPELAAQIHGFVSSVQFDPRHPNIYLMVDVGAGTVDASVFKVKKTSSGTTSFSFFTNAVEAYGVVNLHRHRVRWWQAHLSLSAHGQTAAAELEAVRLPTEYRGHFPTSYTEYIDGVEVCRIGSAKSPDEEFFSLVLNQVAGKVLYRTKKENLLPAESISGMPFFLCGGGSRHEFYKKLKSELKKTPNCSWLNALHRELTLPGNLRADGVSPGEYDRLSVAYGLSQLHIGTVMQVEAMTPLIPIANESRWLDGYVTKDAC